jgi:hypothetical protein
MINEIFEFILACSPISKTDSADKYWAVDASFRYGSTVILNPTAGAIDTISNVILIATGKPISYSGSYQICVQAHIPALDAYNSYVSATGAVLDKNTELLSITPAQYENLQSLFFDIGGTTYEITKNAQICPRGLNKFIGGTSDGIYLIVQDIKLSRLSGVDFILGRPFLERFYTVLDSGNSRVGFATTQFTEADTN